MSKVTLNNVGSLIDATTAATTINGNFAAIQTAFDNTVSRDGTSPNAMAASVDFNGNGILNLGLVHYTVATLPASPFLGSLVVVTDGTAGLSWGATVTGGSSNNYLVWYNGSGWKVLGK